MGRVLHRQAAKLPRTARRTAIAAVESWCAIAAVESWCAVPCHGRHHQRRACRTTNDAPIYGPASIIGAATSLALTRDFILSSARTAPVEGMGCETAMLRCLWTSEQEVCQHSGGSTYLTRRIGRDRPDILERGRLAAGLTRSTTLGYAMRTVYRPCRVRGDTCRVS